MAKKNSQKKERTVQLPMTQIRADVKPNSFDEKNNTIDLVWGVGSKGLRYGWDGKYYEQLSMDPNHVRMERLQSGNAPVLNAHNAWDLSGVIGVVESASIDGGVGTARVRFSSRDDVKPLVQDIRDGIVKNVSIGYGVNKYERQPMTDEDEVPTYLATDWEPQEISMVPVGFDKDATTRAKEDTRVSSCVIINNIPKDGNGEVREMETVKEQTTTTPVVNKTENEAEQKRALEAAKVEGAKLENQRQTEIRALCKKVGLGEEFSTKLIETGKSVDESRAAVIDALAESSKTKDVTGGVSVTGGAPTNQVERAQGIENAIMVRAGVLKPSDLTAQGRQFSGMTLLRMTEDCLAAEGKNVRGVAPLELVKRAMESTGDFPNILANVLNKTLRKPYDESPRTYDPIVRVTETADFKPMSRTQLSGAPNLDLVLQSGEIKRGVMTDAAETYAISTYAKTVAITRTAIINDDLSAFSRVPMAFGYAAVRKELDLVWGLLQVNALMGDGYALFQAAKHNNYVASGSGAAPSTGATGTLQAMRAAFRRQKGLSGELLNLIPKYLIVGSYLEEVAMEILSEQIVATQVSNTNTFKGLMTPIVEPRIDNISATAWFASVDPGQVDVIEMAYLTGQRGIFTESRIGWDVDGLEVKARLDVGCKVLDWRSLYYNYGA